MRRRNCNAVPQPADSSTGTRLHFSERQDGSPAETIDLTGCVVCKAQPAIGLSHALELFSPDRRLYVGALGCDYVYVAFQSSEWLNLWLHALVTWCCKLNNQPFVPLPVHDLADDATLALHKGWLEVQYAEGRPDARYCLLERNALTLFDNESLHKAKTVTRLYLEGVAVLEVDRGRFKASSMTRPLALSSDKVSVEHVYLVTRPDSSAAWKAAFDAHNQRVAAEAALMDGDQADPLHLTLLRESGQVGWGVGVGLVLCSRRGTGSASRPRGSTPCWRVSCRTCACRPSL